MVYLSKVLFDVAKYLRHFVLESVDELIFVVVAGVAFHLATTFSDFIELFLS